MGAPPDTIDLSPHLPSRHGPVAALRSIVDGLGSTPALVTDANLADLNLSSTVQSELGGVPEMIVGAGEPTSDVVTDLAVRLGGRADVIVAMGGGSVLDIAKLAGALAGSGGTLADHLLAAAPFTASVPVVAIPTTAGSGAEVTRTCVVTVGGRKSWAWDEMLRPDAVVLDSVLTLNLPRDVTVTTGLDALVHAVEAATARQIDPQAVQLGMWALATIGTALPAVLSDPTDSRSRRAMLEASTAAGLAIDRCGTGIAHGLGHALASLVSVPHGLAVALCLEAAVDFNVEGGDARCGAVAEAMGGPDLGSELGRFMTEVGLDRSLVPFAVDQPLEATGLTMEALSDVNAPMRLNNVRPPEPADVAFLAERVVDKWERIGGRR